MVNTTIPGFTERQSFSTKDVSFSRSLHTWREHMREVYFSLEIEAGASDTISGALLKRSFASTQVSAMASDAQRVIRSKQLAMRDSVESFCLVFATHGSFEYRQRGKQGIARHGDAYILNASEPYQVDIAQGSQMLCLTLPCELVRAQINAIDDLCGSDRFVDPVLVPTLRQLVESTLGGPPTVDAVRLQDLCLDMIEMMTARGAGPKLQLSYADAMAAKIYDRAAQLLKTHYHDPLFDVSQAAAKCGISVRQLQIAHQKMGTTFGAELLRVRLDKARQLLKSGNVRPRLIGEVAMDCGFVSQAHFAASYRTHFGRSPREDRARID